MRKKILKKIYYREDYFIDFFWIKLARKNKSIFIIAYLFILFLWIILVLDTFYRFAINS